MLIPHYKIKASNCFSVITFSLCLIFLKKNYAHQAGLSVTACVKYVVFISNVLQKDTENKVKLVQEHLDNCIIFPQCNRWGPTKWTR